MNNRTDTLMTSYKPQLALMVYKAESKEDYYLESHDVDAAGQIMQGKPVMQETLQGIVDVFFDETRNMARIGGMIPENMLSFQLMPGGRYKMVWYRPAEIRVMHFTQALKLPSSKTWVPAMVYVANLGSLDVYALKSNARPKENTRLCMAPYFNVSDNGDVCLGSARVKKPKVSTYANLMQYWEDLFWLSEFTHTNGDDEKTKTKLQPLWKRMLTSKTKLRWSDVDELKFYKNVQLKNLL